MFYAKCPVWASGEMVDALVLGTNGATRGGSSPLSPTLNGFIEYGIRGKELGNPRLSRLTRQESGGP